MRYFPFFVELNSDSTVLIYGGGEDAARKVRLLMKTNVTLHLIAAKLNEELSNHVKAEKATWAARSFAAEQLQVAPHLVIGASDEATNLQLSAEARHRNIPVNIVDRADLSTFIVPAIVDRDPLVIAIGTEGAGPVLAQGLRADIEAMLPPTIGGLLGRAASLRGTVANIIPAGTARRAFWKEFFCGVPRDAYLNSDEAGFTQTVEAQLSAPQQDRQTGGIALIDVCDDPELLTLKAHRLLQDADIIIHDLTIAPGVLEYARRDAVRQTANATLWSSGLAEHHNISTSLLEQAAAGNRVVRLYDSAHSALDSEHAALRVLNITNIAIECIRYGLDDVTWGPLIDGTSVESKSTWSPTTWRMAS